MMKHSGGENPTYKAMSGDEKADSTKAPGPVKTHRIVINLDDKNRFTDEVTV